MYRLLSVLILCVTAQLSAGQVVINEFMASNGTAYWDSDLGAYSDWIELYNSGEQAVDLQGYHITDNFNIPNKWMLPSGLNIPAKGYIVLWADRLAGDRHLGFGLSKVGEELAVYNASGELLDSVSYKSQLSNTSMGKSPDGNGLWNYYDQHSAGISNQSRFASMSQIRAKPPTASIVGGSYEAGQTIGLDCEDCSEIYYTLDGSDVNIGSILFVDPIQIDSTSVLRFKAYGGDVFPSETNTLTYFINENHGELPIISIATDPNNLWDANMGIYVHGTGWSAENWKGANFRQGWRRPAMFEYFDASSLQVFRSTAELKVFGSFTSRYGQKPLTLYFTDDHRPKWNVFDSRGFTNYHSLILRNSGQDWIRTMICDGLFNSLVIDVLDVDAQAYRPSIVYLNGRYWGIHNIREKLNEEHFGALNHIDPSRILLQKRFNSTGQMEVDSLIDYAVNNDFSDSEHMKWIDQRIDRSEYLNYMISEFYSANMDWPKNNVRMWKKEGATGKWRWILVDLDVSMGIWNNAQPDVNSISRLLDSNTVNTELLKAVVANHEFRDDLIQRTALLLNTVFTEKRVNYFIDSLSAVIAPEMPQHIERWKDSCSWSCGLASMEDWQHFLNKMRYFADKRPGLMRENFRSRFDLGPDVQLNFNARNGRIIINECDIPFDPSGSYYPNIPIGLTAVPNPGYQFVEWKGIPWEHGPYASALFTDSATIEAVFEPTNHIAVPERISADTILVVQDYPYYIVGELIIDSNATLTIDADNTFLMHQDANIVVRGGLVISGEEEKPVKFRANEFTGSTKWGAISFENSTRTNYMGHVILEEASHGVHEGQIAAINVDSSTLTIEFSVIDNVYEQPVFAKFSHVEIRNSTLRTSITSDIINYKYGTGIVEECLLIGNNEPNTDGVDYDGVVGGIIRNNIIRDFSGFKSDGIDIGESSKDVLIESNRIYNCSDKGVSVGQGSTATVVKNVIAHCNQGVGVKDRKSKVSIDRTIFYKNSIGVASFEKNVGAGGGKAKVFDCVFSQSLISSIYKDKQSKLKVAYSISDMDILKGMGNTYEDPRFLNPDTGNFSVLAGSPCINVDADFAVAALLQTRTYGARMISKGILSDRVTWLSVLGIFAYVVATGLAVKRKVPKP